MRAALVFVAMLIVGVLFALSLGGCATQGGLRGTGEIAPPPVVARMDVGHIEGAAVLNGPVNHIYGWTRNLSQSELGAVDR